LVELSRICSELSQKYQYAAVVVFVETPSVAMLEIYSTLDIWSILTDLSSYIILTMLKISQIIVNWQRIYAMIRSGGSHHTEF